MELENERLQRQLLLLQEQNVQAKQRRKDDREGRTIARAILYHTLPKERAKTISQIQPLDFRPDLMKSRAKTTDRSFMREEWVTKIDPFKEQIDSDVQNKFGYDYGANRFSLVQPAVPVEDRSQVYMEAATLLPERTEDIAPPKPDEPPEPKAKYIYESDKAETPYFRNHLTSRKLNRVDGDLRVDYSRTSQANVRSEDLGQLEAYYQRKQDILATVPSTEINLNSHDSNNIPNQTLNKPTKFEDEFFLNSARTETADEGYNIKQTRPPPKSRPLQLLSRIFSRK